MSHDAQIVTLKLLRLYGMARPWANWRIWAHRSTTTHNRCSMRLLKAEVAER